MDYLIYLCQEQWLQPSGTYRRLLHEKAEANKKYLPMFYPAEGNHPVEDYKIPTTRKHLESVMNMEYKTQETKKAPAVDISKAVPCYKCKANIHNNDNYSLVCYLCNSWAHTQCLMIPA
uniref:Uncharacterized protein n=1 Tax=Romanomermis culicivorax TaxID=13658 RepID=A0A915K7T7_ROMCU